MYSKSTVIMTLLLGIVSDAFAAGEQYTHPNQNDFGNFKGTTSGLQAIARQQVIDDVKQAHQQDFLDFKRSLNRIDITAARAGIRPNISESDFEATKLKLNNFYTTLPVVATVQIPVPNSSSVISYDCVTTSNQGGLKSEVQHPFK